MPRFSMNLGQRPQRPQRDVNHASVLASRSEVFGFSPSSDRFTSRRQAFRLTDQISASKSGRARQYHSTARRRTAAALTAADAGCMNRVLTSICFAKASASARKARASFLVGLDRMNAPTNSAISSSSIVDGGSSLAADFSGSGMAVSPVGSSPDRRVNHSQAQPRTTIWGKSRLHHVSGVA